jgi:hypothetical protein
MSKHEIRLRRQKLTSRGTDRFRNYGAVLERHGEEVRLKKIVRVFTYFLVILIALVLLVIVVRVEKKVKDTPPRSQQRAFVGGS